MTITISTPLTEPAARALAAGDSVLLTGTIYTARDAAHRRLCDLLRAGKPLPIDLRDQVIYYTGPTPARPGAVTGSAGPTTSGRMDAYAPLLIEQAGVRGMIGKGGRGQAVIDAMGKHGCVYFAAVGGAGALIAQCIRRSEVVLFDDLGPEAMRRLEVVEMPLIVGIDCRGRNLYVDGPREWRGANMAIT